MRGTGRTTAQIANAPPAAVYVWCAKNTGYALALAKKLSRDDLKIVDPEWLRIESVIGRRGLCVVVDHALLMNNSQRNAMDEIYAHKALGE